jgi:methylthioribose-1-phosphate isomerase
MATRARTESPPPLHWTGTTLQILDQTRLPAEEVVLELHGTPDTVEAIKRLAVRGAPLIGVAAAYGLAMEVARDESVESLERAAALMAGARPTARNLGWAVERVTAAALAAPGRMADAAREAAEQIHREDEAASAALARHGADILEATLPSGPVTLMTHCNTGALAASGRGTGLAVIAALAERREVDVLACEARPLLQGARLTVWELLRLGIEHALLVDAAAPGLLRRGAAQAVITGFDRVAANGDVANKVGTYGLALAASAAGVPFLAAGPSSSIDLRLPAGDAIEIEERDAAEVRAAGGTLLTVEGTPCRNPAFDVTPAELVWALVTEHGAASPVTVDSVARVA